MPALGLRVAAGLPIGHVAAGAGISRRCLAKWYARWRARRERTLDHSSRPATSPARTPEDIADLVEALRRQTKHGPARLAADLQRLHGVTLAPATVHRIPVRRGLGRLRDLDPPTGEQLRGVIRYEHDRVGDLVHVDIKKHGRIRSAAAGGCTASAPSPPAPPNAPVPEPARSDTRTCIRRSTATPGSPTPRPWTMRRSSPRSPSGTGRFLLRRPRHHTDPRLPHRERRVLPVYDLG
ncbi:helix-turn-helix domain-containing protein [Streptomyces sp. NBC_00105]|uniref:helix-turn-helix domain-containing protein n=1 Tax=Streptomyces sp. NBC_00105 TaxID=2903622 RepID=UPI0038701F8D